MNIILDSRPTGDAYYDKMLSYISYFLAKQMPEHNFFVYGDFAMQSEINLQNLNLNNLYPYRGTIIEQSLFLKEIIEKKADLAIFFDYKRPLFYAKKNIVFLRDLRDVLYLENHMFSSIDKIQKNFFLKTSLAKADNIFCFDKSISNEINDKFDINEDKIKILSTFFIKQNIENSSFDPRITHNIINDYIIYEGGDARNKNINRLIDALKIVNKTSPLDLLIIGDKISTNISLRNYILSSNLQNKVHFITGSDQKNIKSYYDNAMAFVYPSLYEGAIFDFTNAISFNTPIIASNLSVIKNILHDNIVYFNPVDSSNIASTIIEFSPSTRNQLDYSDIIKEYDFGIFMKKITNSISDFLKK